MEKLKLKLGSLRSYIECLTDDTCVYDDYRVLQLLRSKFKQILSISIEFSCFCPGFGNVYKDQLLGKMCIQSIII